MLNVAPGDYVVATHFDSNDDGALDFYLGRRTNNVACGDEKRARLLMIQPGLWPAVRLQVEPAHRV